MCYAQGDTRARFDFGAVIKAQFTILLLLRIMTSTLIVLALKVFLLSCFLLLLWRIILQAITSSERGICSISRYTGRYRRRILLGSRSNWLHGHWGGRAGVAHCCDPHLYHHSHMQVQISRRRVNQWARKHANRIGHQRLEIQWRV